MRDISNHIVDLMENSIRAGATIVGVAVVGDAAKDRLVVTVADDGTGLQVEPHEATDPFFTTKAGKVTGLGLSLLKAAAERAGGTFAIGPSPRGGTTVLVTMQMGHVDREPLGDLACAISSIVCTSPEVEVYCRIGSDGRTRDIRTSDFAESGPPEGLRGLAVARQVSESIRGAISALAVGA